MYHKLQPALLLCTRRHDFVIKVASVILTPPGPFRATRELDAARGGRRAAVDTHALSIPRLRPRVDLVRCGPPHVLAAIGGPGCVDLAAPVCGQIQALEARLCDDLPSSEAAVLQRAVHRQQALGWVRRNGRKIHVHAGGCVQGNGAGFADARARLACSSTSRRTSENMGTRMEIEALLLQAGNPPIQECPYARIECFATLLGPASRTSPKEEGEHVAKRTGPRADRARDGAGGCAVYGTASRALIVGDSVAGGCGRVCGVGRCLCGACGLWQRRWLGATPERASGRAAGDVFAGAGCLFPVGGRECGREKRRGCSGLGERARHGGQRTRGAAAGNVSASRATRSDAFRRSRCCCDHRRLHSALRASH